MLHSTDQLEFRHLGKRPLSDDFALVRNHSVPSWSLSSSFMVSHSFRSTHILFGIVGIGPKAQLLKLPRGILEEREKPSLCVSVNILFIPRLADFPHQLVLLHGTVFSEAQWMTCCHAHWALVNSRWAMMGLLSSFLCSFNKPNCHLFSSSVCYKLGWSEVTSVITPKQESI